MTSGATNTSSRSPTLIDLEVDAKGLARCPDCGEFAIETMVSPFTGNLMNEAQEVVKL